MTEHPLPPSTTVADKAVAQGGEPSGAKTVPAADVKADVIPWDPGDNLTRRVEPHRRQKGEPLYRPLRVYTLDPSASRLEGAIATVNVPYEPLEPGPVGKLFEVDPTDCTTNAKRDVADLQDSNILLTDGVDPSPANARFHAQMVYAVSSSVYNAFKVALGRDVTWGFHKEPNRKERLRLLPFGSNDQNAFYSKEEGAIRFGYFTGAGKGATTGRNIPRGEIYTACSHDIIAHELSHALLDGLRARFLVPTNPDVLAFHEAFGDIVAIFQHFAYPEVVHAAIRKVKGRLNDRSILTEIARQFGETTGRKQALRTALDYEGPEGTRGSNSGEAVPVIMYHEGESSEPHDRGAVLVAAIFATFTRVFWRKIERLLRIATNGTGVLPIGELPHDLHVLLAENAAKIASQFLSICIRAIDYCPPVDITFGEFLRAVITADADLVPSDPWAYREAFLDAFRERGIYPTGVKHLTEDAVMWRAPERDLPNISELSFAKLRFAGDPGHIMSDREIRRQASSLAKLVFDRKNLELFGLADPQKEADVLPPSIESIRSTRRIGPDGQIMFDLVSEIVQVRMVDHNGVKFPFYGGATVVTGPDGNIRYAVVKNVMSTSRIADHAQFISEDEFAKPFWVMDAMGVLQPRHDVIGKLHGAGT